MGSKLKCGSVKTTAGLRFGCTALFLRTYLTLGCGGIRQRRLCCPWLGGCRGREGTLETGPREQATISLMSLWRALVHNLGLFMLISSIGMNCE